MFVCRALASSTLCSYFKQTWDHDEVFVRGTPFMFGDFVHPTAEPRYYEEVRKGKISHTETAAGPDKRGTLNWQYHVLLELARSEYHLVLVHVWLPTGDGFREGGADDGELP